MIANKQQGSPAKTTPAASGVFCSFRQGAPPRESNASVESQLSHRRSDLLRFLTITRSNSSRLRRLQLAQLTRPPSKHTAGWRPDMRRYASIMCTTRETAFLVELVGVGSLFPRAARQIGLSAI